MAVTVDKRLGRKILYLFFVWNKWWWLATFYRRCGGAILQSHNLSLTPSFHTSHPQNAVFSIWRAFFGPYCAERIFFSDSLSKSLRFLLRSCFLNTRQRILFHQGLRFLRIFFWKGRENWEIRMPLSLCRRRSEFQSVTIKCWHLHGHTGCSLNIVLFFLEFSKVCHLSLASTRQLLVVQTITSQ